MFGRSPLLQLELSDNRISNGLTQLQDCPNLTHLNISGNKIKDLDVLEPLKTFKKLTHLDLFNNPICEAEDYRNKLFKLIPSLKYLDGTDVNDEEAEDSDDEDLVGFNGAPSAGDEDVEEEEEGEEEDGEGGEGGVLGEQICGFVILYTLIA